MAGGGAAGAPIDRLVTARAVSRAVRGNALTQVNFPRVVLAGAFYNGPMDSTALSASQVLTFWFGAWPANAAAMASQAPQWFAKSDAFDAEVRARFGAAVDLAVAGGLGDWEAQADSCLALIVLLDQFTRNIHRGNAGAFAGDPRALRLARHAVASGYDQTVPPQARAFFYLPFEHAENAEDQDRGVALFEALQAQGAGQEDAAAGRMLASYADYARRHREVIARFGRFPHRNAALGRASTADEVRYLAEPGAGF